MNFIFRAAVTGALGLAGLAVNYNALRSTSDLTGIRLVEEYEDVRRSATVYLYLRDVKGSNGFNSSGPAQESKHWIIVLEFEDGSWRCGDAQQNDEGRIEPMYSKDRPRDEEKYEKRYLGVVYISPLQFWKYVDKNQLNGTTYFVATSNCQHWCIELANQLGLHIGKEINKIPTFDKLNPVLAQAFSYGSAFVYSIQRALNEPDRGNQIQFH